MPWDYYKNGVSKSFIESFLEDKLHCKLKYVDGLSPKYQGDGLKFGTLMHNVLESFYTEKPFDLNTYDFEGDDRVQENEQMLALAEALGNRYTTYFDTDKTEYKWEFYEKSFRVPYNDTFIQGRFDGGVYKNGQFWIFDSKFLSNINEDLIFAGLPFDIQTQLYIIAARKMGYDPVGIIYNIVRRPQPRKKPTLKALYEHIVGEIESKPDHYFKRIPCLIKPEETERFIQNTLDPVLDDIYNWYKAGFPAYLNPLTLVGKYGKSPFYEYLTTGSTAHIRTRRDQSNRESGRPEQVPDEIQI